MNDHQQTSGLTPKAAVGLALVVMMPFDYAGTILLRTGVGAQAAAPIIQMLAPATPVLWGVVCVEKAKDEFNRTGGVKPAHDPGPVFLISYAIVGALILQRIARLRRRIFGYYSGWPLICRVFRRLDERFVKLIVEPGLLVFGSLFAIDRGFNQPAFGYIAFVGLCMFVMALRRGMYAAWEDQQAYNAVVEAELAQERIRRVMGR